MKTVKEAATAYTNACCFPKNKDDFRRQIHRAYSRGVEFAERWISVDEELPKDKPATPLLVKVEYRDKPVISKNCAPVSGAGIVASIGFYDRFTNRWNILHITLYEWKVTHWRHIELKSEREGNNEKEKQQ
jgi:hypothetical protein